MPTSTSVPAEILFVLKHTNQKHKSRMQSALKWDIYGLMLLKLLKQQRSYASFLHLVQLITTVWMLFEQSAM